MKHPLLIPGILASIIIYSTAPTSALLFPQRKIRIGTSMMSNTGTATTDSCIGVESSLLPIVQRSFPDASSVSIEDNIVQANAEGFGVIVNGESGNSTQLFVKQVKAEKYSHKPWGDLRRTLLYSRTEARFYSDVLPLLKKNITEILPDWNIAPTCHLAETYLHGLIDEAESTSAKLSASDEDPSYDESDSSILHNKGGVLILESLKGDFYQTSPLTQSQASQCLTAIARFHATAFEDKEILSVVSDKLCEYGGSYHLKNRNPKELENLEKTWENFSNELKVAKPELFEKDSVRNLAKRIKALAEDISVELSPAFDDKYATIVHGDYKAMNVFLPGDGDGEGDSEEKTKTDENENNEHAIIIDYASTGVGMGMSDVAMHVTHALHPDDLVNGGEEALVDIYLSSLQEVMPNLTYPKEIAMRHYRLATIDYFRFVMGRLWRGVTLEAFEKRKSSKNAVFVNRNIEAALYFIERADKFLTEIEEENI